MKKTLIQALFCLVTLMCGACTGQSKDDSGKDTPKEFIPTSWNGEFLKAISDAYETFSETDEMPVSVNVEGITYSQAKYFSAACGILGFDRGLSRHLAGETGCGDPEIFSGRCHAVEHFRTG